MSILSSTNVGSISAKPTTTFISNILFDNSSEFILSANQDGDFIYRAKPGSEKFGIIEKQDGNFYRAKFEERYMNGSWSKMWIIIERIETVNDLREYITSFMCNNSWKMW